MQTLTLQKKISLSPKDVSSKDADKTLEERVYNRVEELFKNSCSKTNGYIIGIDRNVKILDNEIGIGGTILFLVELTVQALKPEKGQVIQGTVCVVFEEGIFLEVQECNKMKVLVPQSKLEKYEFNKSKELFQKGKKTIQKGDVITVKLEQIKYDNTGFSCIGHLSKLCLSALKTKKEKENV